MYLWLCYIVIAEKPREDHVFSFLSLYVGPPPHVVTSQSYKSYMEELDETENELEQQAVSRCLETGEIQQKWRP